MSTRTNRSCAPGSAAVSRNSRITTTWLGLEDNKLTYFHGGRFKQLSQFGGSVIKEVHRMTAAELRG